MKNKSVRPRLLTATDTITDRENVERVLRRRSAGNSFFLIPGAAYTLSFCRLTGGATVKVFSSKKQVKSTACLGYRFSSCFAHTSRDNLLVSVKSWALFFLIHFSFKSLWHDMMLYTVDRWISVSYAIRRTVRWLPGWSSWLNIRSSTRQTFSFVLTVRVSSLWRCHSFFRWCHTSQIPQQFLKPDIVHGLLANCAMNFFAPYPFSCLSTSIKTRSSAENTMFIVYAVYVYVDYNHSGVNTTSFLYKWLKWLQ